MTMAQAEPATSTCLMPDKITRLAPELLALRDGLTEIATGLVNAYPSETRVLRVTAPLTRTSDGLFATIARMRDPDGTTLLSSCVERVEGQPFYDWARWLRVMTATRLWMVPKPGLTGDEHLQLAQELVALKVVASQIAQELRRAGGDAKEVKTAYTLCGALADLNTWLGSYAWERQRFSTTYNPYTDPTMHPASVAKATTLLSTFAEVFAGTAQEAEDSNESGAGD